MKVFEFDSYKTFTNSWIESQPKNGWGEITRMARKLDIHTTYLSHTINGEKDLSPEQAEGLCKYMGLDDFETDYYLLLVDISRAGTQSLKKRLKRRLSRLKKESRNIKKRMPSERELTQAEQAKFYSHWLFPVIRQMTEIEGYNGKREIAKAFDFPQTVIFEMIDFLCGTGLLIEDEKKGLVIGPQNTHLGANNPLIYQHHRNWRLKGLERHGKLSEEELMYSAAFTISKEEFIKFREKIIQLIESLGDSVKGSPAEQVSAIGIDWLRIV